MACTESTRGASLIEVVAATAIIGVIFASLLSLFAFSSNTTEASKEKNDMMMAAQLLMEYSCEEEGFSHLEADGLEKSIPIADPVYSSRYDAVRVVSYQNGNPGLKKIVIKVKEKSIDDYGQGVSLATLIADV